MARPLTVSIHSLGNQPFDMDVLDTDPVSDLRHTLFGQLGLDPTKRQLKLMYYIVLYMVTRSGTIQI